MDNFLKTPMAITQEVFFIADNPTDNQVTKEEALKEYYNFISDKYYIDGETKYNFGCLKCVLMTKHLSRILNNCHATGDGIMTLSMVRNYTGVYVSLFLPRGAFEYDKPFNEVLNLDKSKMDNIGEEHYLCNSKHGNIKPDRLEFDTAVDPNYVIMGYDYAYVHKSNLVSEQ